MNQEKPKEHKEIKVTVEFPGISPLKFTVPEPDTSIILAFIHNSPDYCWFSNFDLIEKNGQDVRELFAKNPNADLNLILNVNEFNPEDALEHAKQTVRIIYSSTNQAFRTDISPSIYAWMIRTFQTNKIPSSNDVEGLTPENYKKSFSPQILEYIDFDDTDISLFEAEKGVICKLSLTTSEKTNFTLYCNPFGWYSEPIPGKPTPIFPSLHFLIAHLSHTFSSNYYLVATMFCRLSGDESLPYIPYDKSPLFSESSPKYGSNSYLQLFQPSQSNLSFLGSLQDSIDALSSEDVQIQTDDPQLQEIVKQYSAMKSGAEIANVENEFIFNASHTISLIRRGRLQPGTINRGLYVSTPEKIGSSRSSLIGESQISTFIGASVYPDIRVVRSIVISSGSSDYVGRTEIPGLLTGQAHLVFGFDQEKKKWNKDERFEKAIQKLADDYGFAESTIITGDVIRVPANVKGIEGSDGILYLLGMNRLSPRDANFPEDENAFIRREALSRFEVYKALEPHKEELEALGGSSVNLYMRDPEKEPLSAEDEQKLETARNKFLTESEHEKFDMNALTQYAKDPKFVPDNIGKLSAFVKENLVKEFAESKQSIGSFIIDGKMLVSEMHDLGLNVRYLSDINNAIPEELVWPHILIESEILGRTVKNYIRIHKLSLPEISQLLQKLVAKDGTAPWNELSKISQEKYRFEVSSNGSWNQMLFIRSAVGGLGLTVNPKTLDIVDVNPDINFETLGNSRFNSLVRLGVMFSSRGDWENAMKFLLRAQMIRPAYDRRLMQLYFHLGLIYLNYKQDAVEAARCLSTAMMIIERYSDEQDPQIIILYSILAEIERMKGNKNVAMALSCRAASLAQNLFPEHPWAVLALVNAGEIASTVDKYQGIAYVRKAVERVGFLQLPSVEAKLLNQAAVIALSCDQLHEAEVYEAKAIELDDEVPEYKKVLDMIKSAIDSKTK